MLYDNCVQTVSVVHDVDNMLDHDCVLFRLNIDTWYVSFIDKVHSPHSSWQKANAVQLSNYCDAVNENLGSLNLPTEPIACHDPGSCDSSHYAALQNYMLQE